VLIINIVTMIIVYYHLLSIQIEDLCKILSLVIKKVLYELIVVLQLDDLRF